MKKNIFIILMILISTNIFSQEENIFVYSSATEKTFISPNKTTRNTKDNVIKALIINFEGIAFIYKNNENIDEMKGVFISNVSYDKETINGSLFTVLKYEIKQSEKININEVKIFFLPDMSGFFIIKINDGVETFQPFDKIKFPSKNKVKN